MADQTSRTIPMLPCRSIDETLDFWQALGYEVTYKQKAPNAYGVIRSDAIELHLFGLNLEPKANFSSCLVIISEVEQLHQTYASRLKAFLGKSPYQGIPRMSRMRKGQTRFTLTDSAGNSVIFVRRGGADAASAEAYKQAGLTPLQRTLSVAKRLRDFKGDDAAAAKVLDAALKKHEQDKSTDFARVVATRLELAVVMGEVEYARELFTLLKTLPLEETELPELGQQSFEELVDGFK